jgi:iron complex outermembrane receptor protein
MLNKVTFQASFIALCTMLSVGAYAIADAPKPVDIPAGDLSVALLKLSKQYGADLVYRPEQVHGLKTHGVHGSLTTEQAVTQLLQGTPLELRTDPSGAMLIAPPVSTGDSGQSTTQNASSGSSDDANVNKEAGKKSSQDFRVAQVDQNAAGPQVVESQNGERKKKEEGLTEIIVTANRREQSAQNVAGALQVFSGPELDRLGANQFSDYLLAVPAVSFRDQGAGAERISLRGISNVAGSDNGITAPSSTVGLYLDDISISDTSNLPDIATYDLKRIEVLEGPQGTLYGEGAMGGAIKIVLNEPNLTSVEAKADTTLSDTQGGGFNYGARGLVNIPLLTDKVALRVSATYQNLDGFIDNVYDGKHNIDGSNEYSVRGLLLARMNDNFTAELLALQNVEHQKQFHQEDPLLGDLKIYSVEPIFNDVKNDVFGLTLKYDIGFANFTSISSYYSAQRQQLIRVPVLATPVFGQFGAVTQDPITFDLDLNSVAQELRMVSQGDNRLDWVVGAFFKYKRQRGIGDLFITQSDLPSVNAGLTNAMLPTLPASGTYLYNDTTDTYKQYAGYGEVTYKAVRNLELTAGLRWFHEVVSTDNGFIGYSILAGATATEIATFPNSRVIPKFAISYHVTPDHTVYAQAAQGFRSGITNINQSLGVGGDGAKPDTLWNYEVGTKTKWADGALILNSALFYVDWKDIQTIETEISPISHSTIGFFGNGGNAEIYGGEVELTAAPIDNVLLGTTFGYTHSEMTKVINAASIPGAELPNVPKITASGFGEYRFHLSSERDSYVHFDVQHIDAQATRPITSTSADPSVNGAWVKGYTLGNVRVGFDSKRWGVALFVNNLWNERAELGRGVTGAGAIYNLERYTITRPRTFGLTFSVF